MIGALQAEANACVAQLHNTITHLSIGQPSGPSAAPIGGTNSSAPQSHLLPTVTPFGVPNLGVSPALIHPPVADGSAQMMESSMLWQKDAEPQTKTSTSGKIRSYLVTIVLKIRSYG